MQRSHTSRDRRRVVLELTGMGKDVVRRVNARRRKLINGVLERMDKQEIDQLETSLQAFTDSYLQLKSTERAGNRA
jgi:DNA-binding MarR family transcriptional regulator